MESKPVSGPSWRSRRVLLLRKAPRCSCLTQPFSASHRPKQEHQEGRRIAPVPPARRPFRAAPWQKSRRRSCPGRDWPGIGSGRGRTTGSRARGNSRAAGARRRESPPSCPISMSLACSSRLTQLLNGPADAPPALCRAGRRENAGRHSVGGDFLVVRQIVRRIVRGAESGDVELLQDAVGGQFRAGQLLVGLLPDARGALLHRAVRRCRSSVSVPGGSNDRADCAGCAARLPPRLGISPAARRRRCRIVRPRRWPASPAICNGRLPARSQRGS